MIRKLYCIWWAAWSWALYRVFDPVEVSHGPPPGPGPSWWIGLLVLLLVVLGVILTLIEAGLELY